MALLCNKLFKYIKNGSSLSFCKYKATIRTLPEANKLNKASQYKTGDNFVYLEDPNSFGTLARKLRLPEDKFNNEDDLKEQQYIENIPLSSRKLTIKQYADLIKQYLSHKRLKEAIDVLEVRMLTIDRVKPENYIYNILIGACAEVGYTKKAFKLFNDMKRRALKPTGDTYTCLFHACANSPWAADGLKNAKHLRDLMIEKGVEPNMTNFNVMIKAFGRCGDIGTAFQIVDEMIAKKIKIRVHTFNHLLHACISDKNTGLRHALVVWRKMLKMREKPNLYSFNLMLKCVKDCNLGSQCDIEELIAILSEHIAIGPEPTETLLIENPDIKTLESLNSQRVPQMTLSPHNSAGHSLETEQCLLQSGSTSAELSTEVFSLDNNAKDVVTLTFEENLNTKLAPSVERSVPNLLSKVVQMQQVLALQEVHTVQDRFAVIGGQEDFLKEMEVYSVKPDIKTITQMIPLIDNTQEAENKLLETIKYLQIRADIDFYNLLIKKRCWRSDFEGAFAIKDVIDQENKARKKRHPLKKKKRLKYNIMTYGVLALACRTKESAEKLLHEMKENQLKVNIEILGTLLKAATTQMQFDYVLYIMNQVEEQNINVNQAFMKHLEAFNEKCTRIKGGKDDKSICQSSFAKTYKNFMNVYKKWLQEVNVEEALKTEHPWQQFKETYPETVQHSTVVIKEPKRFFKKQRKHVKPYKAKL